MKIVILLFAYLVFESRGNGLGGCPYERPSVNCLSLSEGLFFAGQSSECYDDEYCGKSLKCCQQGCDRKCVAPIHYRTWCKAPLDLGILFENHEDVWPRVRKMIKDITKNTSISKTGTHVSLGTIGERCKILLNFTDTLKGHKMNRKNIVSLVNDIGPQKRNGSLLTGLQMAKSMFKEANGGRSDAIKVLLVITNANFEQEEGSLMEATVQELKDSGVLMESVAIYMDDRLNLPNLMAIASSDIYVWPGVDTEMLASLKTLGKKPCDL